MLNLSCLWTFGRYLEAAALPAPAASIAALLLGGGWLGAAASANLNSYYVSCGASAGVAALLGAVWADQAVNFRRYVRHAWTCAVLVLVTALVVVASLLPLVGVWYVCTALLAGAGGQGGAGEGGLWGAVARRCSVCALAWHVLTAAFPHQLLPTLTLCRLPPPPPLLGRRPGGRHAAAADAAHNGGDAARLGCRAAHCGAVPVHRAVAAGHLRRVGGHPAGI